jgi:hypothetical protein
MDGEAISTLPDSGICMNCQQAASAHVETSKRTMLESRE